MNRLYQWARRLKNSSPLLQRVHARLINLRRTYGHRSYAAKLTEEAQTYKDVEDINSLPRIFDYWSNTYIVPMLQELGVSNPDEFFAKYLMESAAACGETAPVFVSIGAGNCDTEIRIAQLLRNAGFTDFTIECLEMNPHMLMRGRQMAEREAVAQNLAFLEGDFNTWKAPRAYCGVMANQSLHHVENLEGLFDEIKRGLHPRGYFVTSDIIGRNGHQRWPEALKEVRRFWQELPPAYRYNRQLERHEATYQNWDCSYEAFEGIRAQDILPLLLERFHFHAFIAFSNVTDVFLDRSFGHNFDVEKEWDRAFVDRVHSFDEEAICDGRLTPTHMMAALTVQPTSSRLYARGLSPEKSVRATRRR